MRAMLAAVLMLGAMASGASAQEGREGAAAFVESVYDMYRDDQPWPTDEQRLDQVFSPRLAALIRRDRQLAVGDLPYLDADPICNCQDFEDLRVLQAGASWQARRVVVTVRFVNSGEENRGMFLMEGNPIRGWRIDDVLNPGHPSLAANLAQSNARIEAGGRAAGRD